MKKNKCSFLIENILNIGRPVSSNTPEHQISHETIKYELEKNEDTIAAITRNGVSLVYVNKPIMEMHLSTLPEVKLDAPINNTDETCFFSGGNFCKFLYITIFIIIAFLIVIFL